MKLPMIKLRLISGLLMGGAMLWAVFKLPIGWVPWVMSLIAVPAMLEFYGLLRAAQIPHFPFLGTMGCVALIFTTCWTNDAGSAGQANWDAVILFGITVGAFLRQFPQKNNPRPLETISGTLFGFLYIALLFNFLAKLLFLGGNMDGRLLVLYAILMAKFTDIGAYCVGCAIGRHKLIPRISPAKTWEGVAGGVMTAVLGSVAFFFIFKSKFSLLQFDLTDAIVLGLVLSAFSIVGDLTESLFKRAAGVKDSGRMILGMGGLLDVLDSILFSAPALYCYLRLVMGT